MKRNIPFLPIDTKITFAESHNYVKLSRIAETLLQIKN